MKIFKNIQLNTWQKILTDEEKRIRAQFLCVFAILGTASLLMTVINYFTSFILLMQITLTFAVVNVLNIIVMVINDFKFEKVARVMFSVEIIMLFTAFIFFGEPEGFSAIWSLLLPSCGMLLYRKKYGSILSFVMFVILAFFLWVPFGQGLLQYEYTASFMLRFPILYFTFYCVGLFFEFVREATHRELVIARDKYQYLYTHDALTKLYNRHGFNQTMENFFKKKLENPVCFAIMDIDFFKKVNDTYGHLNGDKVLIELSQRITEIVGDAGSVSRWGGEEFGILFSNSSNAENVLNNILTNLRENAFDLDGDKCKITMSIGAVTIDANQLVSSIDIVKCADQNLYKAKNTGRDMLIIEQYVAEEEK